MIAPQQTVKEAPSQPGTYRTTGPVPRPPRPRTTLVALLGLILVCGVGVLFLAGYVPWQRRQAALVADAGRVSSAIQRVSVVKPRPAPAASDIVLPGTIEARQETTIHARISGYLKKW